MVCEICEDIGGMLTRQKWCLMFLGSVADVQQRAPTCQNCQAISELLQPVSKKATDLLKLRSFTDGRPGALYLKREPSGSEAICEFVMHNGPTPQRISVG